MSIFQFLRIVWARRLLILAATVSCVLGALLVIQIVPPRYEARSRVLLETFKPDPVTGLTIQGNSIRLFTRTQAELIRDYRVAGKVVDDLGWLTDPGLVRAYQNRRDGDERDFRRWAAQQVMDRTETRLLEGSNIMEISFASSSPEQARLVADAIRNAYIDVSLQLRREAAAKSAEWFEAQTEQARQALNAAQTAKTAYERETGVVLPDGQTDVDSARLESLSRTSAGVATVAPVMGGGGAATQLAALDARIAQARATLGPNHPELQSLVASRGALAQQAAREQSAAGAAAAAAAAGVGAVDRAVESTKTRVIAQREIVERLRQLNAEVNVRREQFEKTAQRAAELRQEAAVGDAGLTPLGSATTPQNPAFPNKPLILLGALFGGLGIGIGVALLTELMARRIRSFEDLQSELDVPVLAVLRASPQKKSRTEVVLGALGAGGRSPEIGKAANA
jgi:uncharacterized protein involved in exopolysaccharide biosynthesis